MEEMSGAKSLRYTGFHLPYYQKYSLYTCFQEVQLLWIIITNNNNNNDDDDVHHIQYNYLQKIWAVSVNNKAKFLTLKKYLIYDITVINMTLETEISHDDETKSKWYKMSE